MNRLFSLVLLLAIAWLAFDAGKRSRKVQPVTAKKVVMKIENLPTIPAQPSGRQIAAQFVYDQVLKHYVQKGVVNE